MPGAAINKRSIPSPANVGSGSSVPVLGNAELAREIVRALDVFLPDSRRHREDARAVVRDVLDEWRSFGTRPATVSTDVVVDHYPEEYHVGERPLLVVLDDPAGEPEDRS